MANCVYIPEEIMVCILTRLPLKSILRFKSVCKPWRNLFSSRQFIKLHRSEFSNESLILNQVYSERNIYLLDPSKKKPTTILECPSPVKNLNRYALGCCNGLICTVSRAQRDLIVLWNPATKLFKSCLFGRAELLGFGYDSEGDDFKLVRIACLRSRGGVIYGQKVEVYSFNSDSCTTFEAGFKIRGPHRNALVVNGNPYWFTRVDDKEVLFCCDVTNLVCKIVPMPPAGVNLLDWNGALVCCAKVYKWESSKMNAIVVDVWVFDDVVQYWKHKHSVGPFQRGLLGILKFLRNGNMLGQLSNHKLVVFDPVNGCVVEAIEMDRLPSFFPRIFDGFPIFCLQIFDYTESLTHINGMIQVEEEVEEEEEEDAVPWELFGIDF